MTTNEAADILNLSRRRVLALIKTGQLPAERHGRDWWIAPETVQAFAAKERPQGWPVGRKRKG